MADEKLRAAFDDAVVLAIREGRTTLRRIEGGLLPPLVKEMQEQHPGLPVSRMIDKALQRLRKAGRIHYCSPGVGWKLKDICD